MELTKGWHFPKALQPIADRIQPRDIAVFHGAIHKQKLNFIEKWIINNVKAPLGDFRDWDAITSWATAIADALTETGQAKIRLARTTEFEVDHDMPYYAKTLFTPRT